jgi:hypothetical protein
VYVGYPGSPIRITKLKEYDMTIAMLGATGFVGPTLPKQALDRARPRHASTYNRTRM